MKLEPKDDHDELTKGKPVKMNKGDLLLQVIDIHKDYEGHPLLNGVSLDAHAGETLCLLGESGSGKSTLLRIIAGLELPEAGRILWRGEDITQVPVHLRNFGLMFQDYALFPHLTVYQNVAFGLRIQKLAEAETRLRVEAALEQVHLEAFAQRGVRELSGGEQQRVALARAIAPRPRLIMLDEPLGALDRGLKAELLAEIRALLRANRIPAIYVTHDQDEAFSLAGRVLILHDGRIIQGGAPAQVYQQPVNTWVARFLGQNNLAPGTILSTDPLVIHTALGDLTSAQPACAGSTPGDACMALLRSAAITPQDATGGNRFDGVVEDVVFQGNDFVITFLCPGLTRLTFHMAESAPLESRVTLLVNPEDVLCLPEPEGTQA